MLCETYNISVGSERFTRFYISPTIRAFFVSLIWCVQTEVAPVATDGFVCSRLSGVRKQSNFVGQLRFNLATPCFEIYVVFRMVTLHLTGCVCLRFRDFVPWPPTAGACSPTCGSTTYQTCRRCRTVQLCWYRAALLSNSSTHPDCTCTRQATPSIKTSEQSLKKNVTFSVFFLIRQKMRPVKARWSTALSS